MKLILVAALLVCLLAIHVDGHYRYRHYQIRMYWRRTTSCIYRAARRLSRCYGVRARFLYYGKREIENADENDDQSKNEEQLISARDLFEEANEGSQGGNGAGSKPGIRQADDAWKQATQ